MAEKKSQKVLLKKLEEYGDSYLEEENTVLPKKSKMKTQSRCEETEADCAESVDQNFEATSVKNKKKLNKKQRKHLKKQNNGDIVRSTKKSPMNKKMKWLKEALGSDGAYDLQTSKQKSTHVNLGDKTSGKRKREPEVIVFEDPTRRKNKAVKQGEATQEDGSSEFDMRRARFEVRKLGISGFTGEQKTDARVSLLINLGAKPPQKKTYVNYKEFQKQRKDDLDAQKQRRQEEQVPGEKVPKRKSKKRFRTKSDVGVDGQVGRYKEGVQYINKDTLKKLKVS